MATKNKDLLQIQQEAVRLFFDTACYHVQAYSKLSDENKVKFDAYVTDEVIKQKNIVRKHKGNSYNWLDICFEGSTLNKGVIATRLHFGTELLITGHNSEYPYSAIRTKIDEFIPCEHDKAQYEIFFNMIKSL